ncbi:MAG: DinB family protein [Acidobacteriaceae bacterium]
MALLERILAALEALLRDLPDPWDARGTEGEGMWNAQDIVGHLIHCEQTDWMLRARRIREDGETRVFDLFDWHGYRKAIREKLLGQLLGEFAEIRERNLVELRSWHLPERDLALKGRHPALGTVTRGELLATWAAHGLNHLHQLARLLAHQYREAVVPFLAYMGVFVCNGHSAG